MFLKIKFNMVGWLTKLISYSITALRSVNIKLTVLRYLGLDLTGELLELLLSHLTVLRLALLSHTHGSS